MAAAGLFFTDSIIVVINHDQPLLVHWTDQVDQPDARAVFSQRLVSVWRRGDQKEGRKQLRDGKHSGMVPGERVHTATQRQSETKGAKPRMRYSEMKGGRVDQRRTAWLVTT